jgi:TDG/mug DNA glycosylase family protein
MPRVRSFPPIARADARVLILGTMPGVASLLAGRYYAHPQNAFWPIVAPLLGVAVGAPYAARVRAVRQRRLAVWDVLQSCDRSGSGDAAIDVASARVNDFATFFARHRRVATVLCNGGAAHDLFVRRVLPALGSRVEALRIVRLPSTSPANARTSRYRKAAAWRRVLAPLLP